MKYSIKFSVTVLLFLFSCAVKSLPSGGPPDLSAPYIKSINPSEGSINIKLNESIEIEFNEMLDPNSIKSSIVVIPDIDIKINTYSNKIIVKPLNAWPENSEFKIKIDRGISDYKGNKIIKSKLISFSTSSSISKGYIKGRLFNVDTLKVATVGLYVSINDSLFNYASMQSDYNNQFEFKNIKNGKYVIVALMSDIKNIYSDINFYPYSVFSKEVIINNSNNGIDNINLYISDPNHREKIIDVSLYNKFYGEVELTNTEKIPLINSSLNTNYGSIEDYAQFDMLKDSIYLSLNINSQIDSYNLSGNYKINTFSVDTIPPEIVDSYFDQDRYIIEFSEPVKINSSPFIGITQASDSTSLSYSYQNPKSISLDNIIDKHQVIVINNESIIDLSDNENRLSNNLLSVNRNKNLESGTGSIYGNVLYSGNDDVSVELINIKTGEKSTVHTNDNGEFVFENVFSNKYKLWAYENINAVSNNYFNGTLNPLKLSADFGIYNEIIEVRKNWDIEGIEININNGK